MRVRCSRPAWWAARPRAPAATASTTSTPRPTPAATTHHAKVAATCGSCHNGVLKDFNESAHGTAHRRPGAKARCARPATSRTPSRTRTPHRRGTQVSDGCGNCHEDYSTSFRGSFHGKATSLENKAGRGLRRLPHAAPQPGRLRPALQRPPRQPGRDLRRLPREGQRVVPDLRPARQPVGPHAQPLRVLDLARHDLAAGRRVRLLRPARPAVDAARAGRQAARRVQLQPRRPRPLRAALQRHADGRAHRHRDQLPAAGRHRAAAEVRRSALGARA